MTPLHRACASGRLEAAKALGELGANFAAIDSFLRTPFVVAYQYGQEALMNLCRESYPKSLGGLPETMQPEDVLIPMWSLVRCGRVDLLAEQKNRREAEFSCREPGTGKTNFHTAILSNDDEVASVVLEMLFNSSARDLLDATDNHKQTPLHLASIRGHTKCIEILVKHGAKLDEVDRFGKTALYSAFVNEFYTIVVDLVEAGTTIFSDCGVDPQKVLFATIEFQSVDAVRKLLDAGLTCLDKTSMESPQKSLPNRKATMKSSS
jgi:hypothetical protein